MAHSARQQRVSHDSSSARYRCHFGNNGHACCSSVGFRLSPTPPTRLDKGPSRAKHALLAKNARSTAESCQPIFDCHTAVQQYSLTPTASKKSTKTLKSTRPTIRRGTRRIQWEKNPAEKKSSRKGPFSTGGIRQCKKLPNVVFFLSFPLLAFLCFFNCRWSFVHMGIDRTG